MSKLSKKDCVPCRGGVPPLTAAQVDGFLNQLEGWALNQKHHLAKSYTFPDFVEALAFVSRVGVIAEQQGHHPDLYLAWGKVGVEIWTHKIDGLTESDFIFAAKMDAVLG